MTPALSVSVVGSSESQSLDSHWVVAVPYAGGQAQHMKHDVVHSIHLLSQLLLCLN